MMLNSPPARGPTVGRRDGPTPILLVVGFFGSGKTTLLRRIAAESRNRRLIFVVNEFSNVDVDGHLVEAAGGQAVISVAGGSIFCRCKVTEFIERLSALKSRIETEDFEGVVIEASGMADPRTMGKLLQETGLHRFYRLARVVAVLDPARFLKLRHTLPTVGAQVQAADMILLNKADVYPEELLRQAEASARELRPGAAVLRTVHCEAPFEWFPPALSPWPREGVYAARRDPHFETLRLEIGPPPDFEDLRAAVEPVRDDIYRIKGVVRGPDGIAELWEDDGRGPVRSPAPSGATPTPLVIVCRGGAAERVRAALAGVTAR